ncbi:hypothetical protein QUW15_04020 [Desulfovibrio piger]|nr:hypothetical protein [Desulfovibrio piger]
MIKQFRGITLSLLLLCALSGCGESQSPGTLTLTVSGKYADDFTARGWTTARLTATAVDAEGKSLPVDGNIVWWVQTADIHDKIVAWNGDRHDGSGLLWGETPFQSPQAGSDEFPRDATVFLTDTVGSRTVTVMAKLRIAPEDTDEEGQTITAQTTFTFGDGPLSLFSAPPRRVASREEAERYCAAAQQGGKTMENGLPPATLLQLVSNNRINGYGAALFAGWPGDFEERHIYSYWARETGKDGKEGRVVNIKDGLALWYDADARGPLAVCAPKNIPAPPAPDMPPGKAALRAEAEEMLLPRHPDGLSPLPDIWKLRCKKLVPAAGDVPLFYEAPPLAEYNNCYAASVATAALEQPTFSKEEILSFDPASFPQPVIAEPLFSLEKYDSRNTFPVLMRKAREGNPAAMLAISRRLPENSPSRFFWWRLADALTRPGWAYGEEGESIPPSLKGLLGDPREMFVLAVPFLDAGIGEPVAGAPDRRKFYRELMRECALRGRAFAWVTWAYMYAYNIAGSAIPKGVILDKPSPTRGYAMALAGNRLPIERDGRQENASSYYAPEPRTPSLETLQALGKLSKRLPRGVPFGLRADPALLWTVQRLERSAAELGIDEGKGKALAEELFAVYQENYQRVLERQRRHRARMLPEVNRQIDGWLKDMERLAPEWLKKEWPTYPAYGDEDV